MLTSGIRRLGDIAPRRHSSKEHSITHPLPVFQHQHHTTGTQSQSGRSSDASSSSRSSMGASSGLVMSRAETFSSDHRHIAHAAMEAMFRITR